MNIEVGKYYRCKENGYTYRVLQLARANWNHQLDGEPDLVIYNCGIGPNWASYVDEFKRLMDPCDV